MSQFRSRVEAYAKLERKLESELPKLPEKAEPEKIVAHKEALIKAIQSARAGASRHDLFIPEVQPILKEAIRSAVQAPGGAETRKEIVETSARSGETEQPAAVKLDVNAIYPANVSLSTVPPEILMRLPQLPEEVDYRFVGRHLILRSVNANLILDVLPDALPPPSTTKKK